MKATENIMKDMTKFIQKKLDEGMPFEQINEALKNYQEEYNKNIPEKVTEQTAKTADEFLELAEETDDEAKAEKYVKRALALEPDNLDAVNASLDYFYGSLTEYYVKLGEAVKKGTRLMEKQGFMKEDCIGKFWGLIETRPYMRLLGKYADFLKNSGMMTAAARKYEEMLRLSENDNMGVRYSLMHIYAFLGQEEKALRLMEKYDDADADNDALFIMPLSVLYFNAGDWRKSEKYVKRLCALNKETRKFFKYVKENFKSLDDVFKEDDSYGYSIGTMDELEFAFRQQFYLYGSSLFYIHWVCDDVLKLK